MAADTVALNKNWNKMKLWLKIHMIDINKFLFHMYKNTFSINQENNYNYDQIIRSAVLNGF